jgi:cation diffusion facilitator family transporter
LNPSVKSIYRSAIKAALLGLIINLILGIVKLVGGFLGHSFALISDAVNSLGDVFTSLVVVIALRVAQRPPDAEHPYGHTRAEAIAGANVALLIVVSAVLVGWEAMGRIGTAHELPPFWTLWIAGANVLIKEVLYWYKLRVGRRTQSSALIANAWDHRSDAFCSLAVLIGLGIVRWGGTAWGGADEVAAMVVAAAIVWTGVRLFRRSASELMDVQASPDFVAQVREVAAGVAGVMDVEKLWVRKSGLEYFVDIHIGVDSELSVSAGHRIGHAVKDELCGRLPMVRDVLVHLEPFPHDHST